MGTARVTSSLGEPLVAEIELLSVRPGEEGTLAARLATPGTFNAAGIEYVPALLGLRFAIETRRGRTHLLVTTGKPVNDPALTMLVELSSSSGRSVRQYTLFIDPPGGLVQAPSSAIGPANRAERATTSPRGTISPATSTERCATSARGPT